MSAEAIAKYLQARTDYEAMRTELASVADMFTTVANALRNTPTKLIFSNTSGQGLPMEASMSRDSISVNANDWKTPQQLMEMLARVHQVRDRTRDAWFSVPENMRSGLQAPPQGVLPEGRRG